MLLSVKIKNPNLLIYFVTLLLFWLGSKRR